MKEKPDFSPRSKLNLIKAVLVSGLSVTAACKKWGVSRKTLYKWLRRYQEGGKKLNLKTFTDKAPQHQRRDFYWNQTSLEHEEVVLEAVRQHPEYSVSKLVEVLPKIGGKPLVSCHGVQKILERKDLSLLPQRLVYAQSQATPVTQLINVFRTGMSWLFELPKVDQVRVTISSAWVGLGLLLWLLLVASYELARFVLAPLTLSQRLGMGLALWALLIGTLFLFYSLKYYFTLAVVLSFSRQNLGEEEGWMGLNRRIGGNGRNGGSSRTINGAGLGGVGGWLGRVFGIEREGRGGRIGRNGGNGMMSAGGLQPSLEHIKLKRHPFVSVHLPFYNEKRVAERILGACTAMDYPNFEIIVCDDSTDETVEIVQRYAKAHNRVHPEGPKIRVLHRPTREGFKGGALSHALKHMDSRTEFICVFDADFIPYPDTLELFVKYFQVNAGGLDFAKVKEKSDDRGRKTDFEDRRPKTENYPSSTSSPQSSNIAVVGGYQWHVLNKSENWVTRGVRAEYAGSYVIERPGREVLGLLKQISGSVYMIRADVLKKIGWGTSITEDFQLTLKLYEQGYKVVYTPYIQTPAECVSTLKRLIRQRMRWAEGHSFNVKKMFGRLMFGRWVEEEKTNDRGRKADFEDRRPKAENYPSSVFRPQFLPSAFRHPSSTSSHQSSDKKWISSPLTLAEKLEFLYLAPYYLQAFFFLVGTFSWLIAELVFRARLPFWTSLWGWSLVFTNMLSLPLMNAAGLFLEESEERDYLGLLSFFVLAYVLVPFQAYASVKGFIRGEGPWFRTPKTGLITDIFTRGRFYRWVSGILPGRRVVPAFAEASAGRQGLATRVQPLGQDPPYPIPYTLNPYLALATANNRFNGFKIKPKRLRWVSKAVLVALLVTSTTILSLTRGSSEVLATNPETTQYLRDETTVRLNGSWVLGSLDVTDPNSETAISFLKGDILGRYEYQPGVSQKTLKPPCQDGGATGKGWILDIPFENGGSIAQGTWQFTFYESDGPNSQPQGTFEVCAYRVSVSGGLVTNSYLIFDTANPDMTSWPATDIIDNAITNSTYTTDTINQVNFSANEYLYIQYSLNGLILNKDFTTTFYTGDITGTDPKIVLPTITIPEKTLFLIAAAPFIPIIVFWLNKREKRNEVPIIA